MHSMRTDLLVAPAMSNVAIACLGMTFAYAVYLYLDYTRAVLSIRGFPVFRQLTHPMSVAQGINDKSLGKDPLVAGKFKIFENGGWDALCWMSVLPKIQIAYILADPDAIKEVTSNRVRFVKPVESYKSVCLYGENIVASEGEAWKRHRKIAAPAFSNEQNQLVWDETTRVIDELINDVWNYAPEVNIRDAKDITLPTTVSVISAAGFGKTFSWVDDQHVPAGHEMSFRAALHTLCAELLISLGTPRWAMGINKRLRKARLAIDEVHRYMLEMIEEHRQMQEADTRCDILSLLMGDEGDATVTDRELTGNIFIFLLAGHETTAHALAYTLAFLALYPECQEHLFREIQDVTDNLAKDLTYKDMDSLPYALAVFTETVRMAPGITSIPKKATEDTALTIGNQKGEKTVISVPAGTHVVLDTMGLHYNPRYWPDPYNFKPERFLGDWNRDAFIGFSAGVRGCIGRRFAETEAVVVLTKIVSQYTIKFADHLPSESFEQRKARVMEVKAGLTTTPTAVPLTFVRREQ